jgi:hypothetical protein
MMDQRSICWDDGSEDNPAKMIDQKRSLDGMMDSG